MSTTHLQSAATERGGTARPRFSVVSAVYNVADYIEAFLASLDRQTYGIENLEVVLVDDGSTDGAGQIAERWAAESAATVRFLRQENAGQGAARNAGIEVATGEWVTFADPDDVLADDYFATVATFLDQQADAPDVVATRQLIFHDDHATAVDSHPLRRRFVRDEVVDLSRFPNRIQLSGCSAFLVLDRLRTLGLRFDPRIRPTFEDGHLIGRYLLESRTPRIGFVRSAEYYYRKRLDGTSSVQSAWARDEKYTAVPRYGYLDLLQQAVRRHGTAPLWAQNTVLYDLLWYFRTDARLTSPTGSIAPPVLEEFHRLCAEIFEHIDVETILGFRIVPTGHWLRQAVVAGYKDQLMRPQYVRLDRLDPAQRLVRARYDFAGPQPAETFYWRGRVIDPVHQKVRAVELLGRPVMYERIVWLPADGTLRAELDGRPVPLSTRGPADLPYQVTPARLAQDLRRARPATDEARSWWATVVHAPARWTAAARSWVRSWFDRDGWRLRVTRAVAGTGWARRRFDDAWVLADRHEQAKDNAEHLYRYLKRKRPEVNAWFVLERTSPDWRRLEREGFKLVARKSLLWRVALIHAAHVISSHVNVEYTNPLPPEYYPGRTPRFRFTFLQHGVTKDDLSRWLNPKRIDLIATVTEPEQRSFTADGTPYVFTDREVQRTGFPRHDRLLALAQKVDEARVDQILVMPTWRRSLTEALPEGMSQEECVEVFRSSDYARHWIGFLRSPRLRELAQRSGSRLVLLPHPHPGMAGYLRAAGLPEDVEVLDWKDIDVQDVITRSRMLVTDYTSVAFDVAMLGKPVAYYQFDRAQFFSSGHLFRRGYFDYDRDGFGPVAHTEEELLAAVAALAERDFVPDAETARRIETVFGERRGDACYRVYKAISRLDRPVRARPVGGTAAGSVVQLTEDESAEQFAREDRADEGLLVEGPLAQELVVGEEAVAQDTSTDDDLVGASSDGAGH